MGILGRKRKAPSIDREQSLRTIPVVNSLLEIEDDGSDALKLKVPFKPNRIFRILGYIGPTPTHKMVTLDRLGAEFFKLCDGQRAVDEIIREFAARHKLNLREAELSGVSYLKSLAKRGIIVLAVPEKEAIRKEATENRARHARRKQRRKKRK
ncbi:MAG TPA: PqqD family protein [Candidatus Brocadiia bacterium]|nr:PqqD family protein [Candidatus Brocadiia bacterium]